MYELNAQQMLLAQDNDCIVVASSHPPATKQPDAAAPPRKATVAVSRTSSKSNGATMAATAAAAAANQAATSTATATATKTAAITADGKPARRVLPEHEGRYKITLPAGTTPRSKQILAKKAMRKCSNSISTGFTVRVLILVHSAGSVHSDQPNNGQRGIFDRLELNGGLAHSGDSNGSNGNSSGTDSPILITSTKITVTGLNKRTASTSASVVSAAAPATAAATASSIFRRLGGKTTSASSASSTTSAAAVRASQPLVQRSIGGGAPTLMKRPVAKALDSVTKVSLVAGGGGVRKKTPQKVILVKKQPAKATRPDDYDVLVNDDDDEDVHMSGYGAPNRSGGEKCVSFSEEDEVLEFASCKTTTPPPPPTRPKPKPAPSSVHAIVHVKDRLGFGTAGKPEADAQLHRTRKTVPLKPAVDSSKVRRPLLTSPPMRLAAAHSKTRIGGRPTTTSTAAAAAASGRQVRVPVHSRLTLGKSNSSSSSAAPAVKSKTTGGHHRASVSSVFERLGFND